MPPMSPEERDDFLDERGVLLRIAVTREDGSPLVTPIWYLHEAGSIYVTPRQRSEWFRCLRHDPRVAVCVDESELPYRKILVEGRAELLHDVGEDDAWRDLYRRIARRYLDDEAAEGYVQNTIDEPRGLYRLDLGASRVRSWRMPVPGESAEGIWHRRYYQDPNIEFGS